MIRLQIEKRDDHYAPETHFFCEKCGQRHGFYSIPIKTCRRCTAPFPELQSMKLNIKTREEYHWGHKANSGWE